MESTTQAVSGPITAADSDGGRLAPAQADPANRPHSPPPRGRALSPARSRAVLILTGERSFGHLGLVDPDLCKSRTDLCIPSTFSGTPEAIAAALAGDIKRTDEMEIAWRNAWRILPRVPAAELKEQRDRGLDLMAFSIERSAGPACESLIEWSWVRPCPRCWRRLALRARCYKCSGNGWIGDERELFYADLDGNVIEVH